MPEKQSADCHRVPAKSLPVTGHHWQYYAEVQRPAVCTNSFHLYSAAPPPPTLPQACHGTVHMPAVRASLLYMAACDQQVA